MVNPFECLTSVYQNPSSKDEEQEVINQLLSVIEKYQILATYFVAIQSCDVI